MGISSICLVLAAPVSGSPPFHDWQLAAVILRSRSRVIHQYPFFLVLVSCKSG